MSYLKQYDVQSLLSNGRFKIIVPLLLAVSSISVLFFDGIKPQLIALGSYAHSDWTKSTDSRDSDNEIQFRPGSLWDKVELPESIELEGFLRQEPDVRPRSDPSTHMNPDHHNIIPKHDPDTILGTGSTQQTEAQQGRPSTIEKFPYSPWDRRVTDAKSRNVLVDATEPDPIYDYLHYKPLNILTLGGSVAWGGYIPNRYDAFAFLLNELHPNSRVDNLAIRATGAAYPAACIQSLLDGGDGAFPEYQVAPSSDSDSADKGTIYYDIILLEFSVNGIALTDSLVSRLKRRYPDALLVYVHLESITHPQPTIDADYIQRLMAPVDGVFYMFPKEGEYAAALDNAETNKQGIPEYLDLYADDKHHLSEVGHKLVADEIMELLYRTLTQWPEKRRPIRPRLGTWGGGDQCYLWLSSWGYFPESIDVIGGGEFLIFDVPKKKYSYEIGYGQNATLTFDRKSFGGKSIPLHLVYMTLGNPPVYPTATVDIYNGDKGDILSNHIIDPQTDDTFPEWSWAHLTRPEIVGKSQPGTNRILIKPLEETENPFRLVGIIICGACEESESSLKASNIRVRVPDRV